MSAFAVGTEFLVNTGVTADNQNQPTITALSDTRFVVSWRDNSGVDGSSTGIQAQMFEAGSGTPTAMGTEFAVNTGTTAGGQREPTITALSDSRFVVSWTDPSGSDGDSLGIKAQVFDAGSGTPTPVGTEFIVNAGGTAGLQVLPTITALSATRFVVSWTDISGSSGSGSGIKAQVFEAGNGTPIPVGTEFLVNTGVTTGNQSAPTITALSDSRFVVSWTDTSGSDGSGNGIKAQVFGILDYAIAVSPGS